MDDDDYSFDVNDMDNGDNEMDSNDYGCNHVMIWKRRVKGKVQWKELAAPLSPKVAKPLITIMIIMMMIMRQIMIMEMMILVKMVVMMMVMMMIKITLSCWCCRW